MCPTRDRTFLSLFQSLIFCGLAALVHARPSIWDVHIDNGPTPPADEDPNPKSAAATRDPRLLGPELGAIFGSYLLFVIFVCIGILTIGRRFRRSAQSSPNSLGMELVKPVQPVQMQASTANPWGPSPISPVKNNEQKWPSPKPASGWGSIMSKHKHKGSVQSSVMTFDDSVIEEDKNKNDIEMDRLYAAVAEHEAERTAKQPSQITAQQVNPPLSPLSQNPPEFQHLRQPMRAPMPEQYPLSPPPDSEFPSRISTTSPGRTSTKSPRRLNKPSPITIDDPHSRNSSRSSFASFGKRRGTSIRGLPISPPMGSPDFDPENTRSYGDTEPLTPRHYNPPPPPPTPPRNVEALASPQPGDTERRFHFHPSIRSSRSSFASSGWGPSPAQTPRTATFPVAPPPAIAEEQHSYHTGRHEPHSAVAGGFNFALDPAPSSGASTPKSTFTKASKKTKPAPLTLPGGGSQASLPLRTAPLPFRSLLSPRSRNAPANDIKAQEVVRPDKDKSRLMAPGSAVPATPYSPYMPQTPLTPMTPSRLVTREERKRMKKEQGRRVLTQDDIVPEEDDMWGDGY